MTRSSLYVSGWLEEVTEELDWIVLALDPSVGSCGLQCLSRGTGGLPALASALDVPAATLFGCLKVEARDDRDQTTAVYVRITCAPSEARDVHHLCHFIEDLDTILAAAVAHIQVAVASAATKEHLGRSLHAALGQYTSYDLGGGVLISLEEILHVIREEEELVAATLHMLTAEKDKLMEPPPCERQRVRKKISLADLPPAPLCDDCGTVSATLQCQECDMEYCKDCSKRLHKVPKRTHHTLESFRTRYKPGMRVLCNYASGGFLYAATVGGRNDDGTYAVVYDDDSFKEATVRPAQLYPFTDAHVDSPSDSTSNSDDSEATSSDSQRPATRELTCESPSPSADLTPGELADLTPGELADLTPGELAELTPGELAELTPGELAELLSADSASDAGEDTGLLSSTNSREPRKGRTMSPLEASLKNRRRRHTTSP